MLQAVVYDLMVAAPHEPKNARFTHDEFLLYKQGYDEALKIVARALEAAYHRYELIEKTRRLDRRPKGGR